MILAAGDVHCGPGRRQGACALCACLSNARSYISESCQTAAEADDVWGDIRDDEESAEASANAAREAAVAAAVDRFSAPLATGFDVRATHSLSQCGFRSACQRRARQKWCQEEQGGASFLPSICWRDARWLALAVSASLSLRAGSSRSDASFDSSARSTSMRRTTA